MKTYLYRAIATETIEPEGEWDIGIEPGDILGRQSGYLSRSSAREAGESSGCDFEIVRSKPVSFASGDARRDRHVNALVDLAASGASTLVLSSIAQDIQRLSR